MVRENGKSVTLGNNNSEIRNETNRSIRKIMEVIERYTDYNVLEDDRKSIVRDTVLNQVNRLVRISRSRQTMIFNPKD